MRYPEGHKEAIRAKIVEAASKAIRRDGIAAVSIPALMKSVGLTHGGFYVHFKNRDELVAEAIRFAAEKTRQQVFDASDDLEQLLTSYVSEEHAARPQDGCVVAALGTDASRQSQVVRDSFDYAAHGLVDLVAQKVEASRRTGRPPTDESLRVVSQMVGALVLARMLKEKDSKLADRVLRAGRGIKP